MSRPVEVKQVFKKAFGYTPTYEVRAPGHLELLGNQDEFNHGLVLALAVDKYVYAAASPRGDGKIELASSVFPEQRDKFWISEFKRNPETPWTDLVKGVLDRLRRRGVYFGGFNAAFHTNIPAGVEMGHDAALAAATALVVRLLYPHRITESGSTVPPKRNRKGDLPPLSHKERLFTARLCHAAQSEFAGIQTGLVGPLASLLGKEFHVVQTDLLHQTVERFPLIGEIAIIVCDSGVPPDLSVRRAELKQLCESAAKKLRAKSLRSVELRYLSANKKLLTEPEYQCAYHIVGENHRVVYAERALREDDLGQFAQYLTFSHESLRDFYRTSSPEQDLLVHLARDHPACLGARATGNGLGGATVNVIMWAQMDAFMKFMAGEYEQITGRKLTPTFCRVVDGAE